MTIQTHFIFIFSLIPPSQATALNECQHQFSSHRWNCTFSDKITEDVIIQRGLLEGKYKLRDIK